MPTGWDIGTVGLFNGRTFMVRPVSPDVLRSRNVGAAALAESLDKSYIWPVGFFFADNMELWNVTAWVSGFDD